MPGGPARPLLHLLARRPARARWSPCGCLLALSRDRLWLLATLAIGALGALPAVLAVQARHSLADNLADQAAVDQGVTVLLILLAGIALSLLLFAGLRRAGAARGRLTRAGARALAQPDGAERHRRWRRRWSRSASRSRSAAAPGTSSPAPTSSSPATRRQHFAELSGAGRHEFWRVAIDAFGEKPVLGHGAGTYQFSWDQLRSIDLPVHDAHSLYLEAFAELGRRRRPARARPGRHAALDARSPPGAPRREPQRERYAALLAAMLAFAVGAGLRLVLGDRRRSARSSSSPPVSWSPARCAQLAADPRRRRTPEAERAALRPRRRRPGARLDRGVALVGPLLVDREIDSSQSAAADGRPRHAPSTTPRPRARSSPGPPRPTCSSACWPSCKANYPAAIERLRPRDRPRGPTTGSGTTCARRSSTRPATKPRRRADLEQARRLNPLAKCLRGGWSCG